ncbi:twin-arginine translocase subunit TatC, partial [Salmonella enterica subsp. enterica serovar Kentucky]|nr:twin-arginine translocase subunit TatC [Salmonella enterica subsp. enterica serovar Kentucky]
KSHPEQHISINLEASDLASETLPTLLSTLLNRSQISPSQIALVKLTFMVSLILSAPVILYQVWAFIAPALYKHERRLVVPLLVS